MTNEAKEAIEYLEKQIRVCNENAEICDDNNFDEEATHLREESYMLYTVLSLIKEQQEEIENITTNHKNLIADASGIAKELGLEEDATIDEIYTAIRILKSKRINVIEQLDCIEVKNKEIDKLKAENKNLLRKLRNRVKQVKKLEKYSLYKSEFSRLNERIRKKDRQIELMAKYWNTGLAMCDNCDKIVEKYEENNCQDYIKQYFENKVNSSEQN